MLRISRLFSEAVIVSFVRAWPPNTLIVRRLIFHIQFQAQITLVDNIIDNNCGVCSCVFSCEVKMVGLCGHCRKR